MTAYCVQCMRKFVPRGTQEFCTPECRRTFNHALAQEAKLKREVARMPAKWSGRTGQVPDRQLSDGGTT